MTKVTESGRWICCQLGAREYYAIPRALYRKGALQGLLTDSWRQRRKTEVGGQKSVISRRFHEELADAPVTAFNASLIAFELLARVRGLQGWEKVICRNDFFQRKAVASLRQKAEKLKSESAIRDSRSTILFSYSYVARGVFRFAKEQGWKTVLGQIDPGPVEEEIVRKEHEALPEFKADWKRTPASYWEHWREECELADRILVNSEWAKSCLKVTGIEGDKVVTLPLAYEEKLKAESGRNAGEGATGLSNWKTEIRRLKDYPSRFTRERPMRVLFLGQINLRKGVARLLKAAEMLTEEPVEFWMVGPMQCTPPDYLRKLRNVRWFGRVVGEAAHEFYRTAHVFILPTLSDGFALTQLEAQAHGLPLIVSKNCGEVLHDGVNGIVVAEPTPNAIAHSVQFCLKNPDQLREWSRNSRVDDRFSIDTLAENLQQLAGSL